MLLTSSRFGWICGLAFFVSLSCAMPGGVRAADPALSGATVQQAQKVIDLSQLSVFPNSESPGFGQVGISRLSYQARGNVKEAFEFHQKQLVKAGWKELPQTSITDQYASGTFTKQSFLLSLSVTPSDNANQSSVALQNHGNVDLSKLPLPPGSKPLYAGPVSAIFTASASPEETRKFVGDALRKQGWTSYGTAGDQMFFRQNAIRLSANIMSAPAQAGKTMITYSTEQLSAELPVPADAIGFQYADVNHRAMFDTTSTPEQIVKFYQEALAPAKWKSTLDKTIRVDFHDVMIFRDPAKNLIQLDLYPVNEKLRVEVKWQSAVEVADAEKRAKVAIEAMKAMKNQPTEAIEIALPTTATDVTSMPKLIEFHLATGTAKDTVTKFRGELEKQGWMVDSNIETLRNESGTLMLKKGSHSLTVFYVDPGFIPAEVSVSSTSGDLKIKK